MHYTLVRISTKLELCVDFSDATVVGPIRKLNCGNKCFGMCTGTIALKRDSQQMLGNVRLT